MITRDADINYRALTVGVVSFVGILASIVVIWFIINTNDNPLAVFAGFLAAGLFISGAVAPRATLYWLVPVTFCLDFIKRLLVLFTELNWDSISYVLAVAPVATGGVLAGCVLRRIFIRRKSGTIERWLLLIGSLLAFLGAVGALRAVDMVETLKTIANNSVYYFLPWAMFQCFETREDIERFLKVAVATAIPVALYGIWQFVFGLRDFELAYIQTGYAANMAFTVDDVRPRPFSTLSSPHAYSVTMSFMLVLAFFFAFRRQGFDKKWFGAFLLLLVAVATSMARGAFLTGLGMLFISVLFTSKRGTRAAYLLIVGSFTALLMNAEAVLDRLEFWQKHLPSEAAWQEQAFRVSTISNRLMGYKNVLANPSAWPLVANPLNYKAAYDSGEALHAHDLYSELILKYGIVPLALGGMVGVWLLIKTHAAVFRLPAGQVRNLGAGLFSIVVGFFLSQTGGSGIGVFPLNFWIGIIGGCIVILCFRAPLTQKQEAPLPIRGARPSRPAWTPRPAAVPNVR